MTEREEKALVRMFKALSHPNRFRLFMEILEGSESEIKDGHACFLNPIMERLNVGAPTVSHHLKELVQADLVETERQGKFLTCRVNEYAVRLLSGFLTSNRET